MLALQAWLMVLAVTAPADIEVVKFTSQSCVPCRAMEPTLQQVKARGFRVSYIDVDQRADLATQYGVTAVPTLLIVTQGRIVDRVEGLIPAEALFARLAQVASPRSISETRAVAAHEPALSAAATAMQPGQMQPETRAGLGTGTSPTEMTELARQATVRLRVEDSTGHSYGTGTIIDSHGQEALVLTCGHIFRDSKGKGQITVQRFSSATAEPLVGQLIRYDLDRDLALVGIRITETITPIPVAGPDYHVAEGQRLFSVGCNHGHEPTVMPGHLKAVNKYLGPENLVVSGQPVDGRSGGGLFSYDGHLVGICNAADPSLDEGLYAAFASIHRHLDDAKLSFVYRKTPGAAAPADAPIAATAAQDRPLATPDSRPAAFPASSDAGRARGQVDEARLDDALARGAIGPGPAGAEVICIIRTKDRPDARSQVVVLERPSRDFLAQLEQEQHKQQTRQMTQLRIQNAGQSDRANPADRPFQAASPRRGRETVRQAGQADVQPVR